MIVLTATTDNLQAVLAGSVTTNQPQCVTSWRDITTTDFTPGRTVINTNNTTDVNIVAAPAASTQRVVDLINIYNKDTVAAAVTVKFDANGTEYILWKGSLAAGESVQYVEGKGWQRLSALGTPQTEAGEGALTALSGEAILAGNVTVSTDVGTKQTLYTVPAGKKCIVTKVIVRTASTSLAAMGDAMTLGFDAGASDWGNNITGGILVLLVNATKALLAVNDSGFTASVMVIGNPADVFGCIFNDTGITGTVQVDVFGYLY